MVMGPAGLCSSPAIFVDAETKQNNDPHKELFQPCIINITLSQLRVFSRMFPHSGIWLGTPASQLYIFKSSKHSLYLTEAHARSCKKLPSLSHNKSASTFGTYWQKGCGSHAMNGITFILHNLYICGVKI